MTGWWRFSCFLLVLFGSYANGQNNFDQVEIEPLRVGEGLYMLTGAGGNMGLSLGTDGTVLIDDQFAPLSEKILSAIRTLGGEAPRFVVNTHWHGDHTGGNTHFHGAGSLIVAQENVRARMSRENIMSATRTVPPSPATALPVITFSEEMSFHWNQDEIQVMHVGNAHTDGDAIIRFVGANVLHAGDLFFNGSYPFIDGSSGGQVDGMLAGLDLRLSLSDEASKIIPGHGPLASKADLQAHRDMLAAITANISKLIAEGKQLDAIVAARPTAAFDEEYGGGFISPERLVTMVHGLLTQ